MHFILYYISFHLNNEEYWTASRPPDSGTLPGTKINNK